MGEYLRAAVLSSCLQKMLRVPLVMVWPRHIVILVLVRVCVLHGNVTVTVVVVGAAASGCARRLNGESALAQGCRGGCIRVLLDLRGHAGVSLGLRGRGHGVRCVPRLTGWPRRFRVGSSTAGPLGVRVRAQRV